MLRPGEKIIYSKTFTQLEVDLFSLLTGDNNPIHTHSYFLQHPEQGGVIVQGMLAASIFGKIFGSDFPGPGTINIERSFTFLRPLFVGYTYNFVVTLKKVDARSCQGVLKLAIKDINNITCVIGSTLVKNDNVLTPMNYPPEAE